MVTSDIINNTRKLPVKNDGKIASSQHVAWLSCFLNDFRVLQQIGYNVITTKNSDLKNDHQQTYISTQTHATQ
jgi:hypothetical protein